MNKKINSINENGVYVAGINLEDNTTGYHSVAFGLKQLQGESANTSVGAASLTANITGTYSGPFGDAHLYFTPDIEDIRVGYECEICHNLGYNNKWEKVVGRAEKDGAKDCNLDNLTYDCLIDGHIGIRVPYLTSQQIIDEGWKKINSFVFKKKNFSVKYNFSRKKLYISLSVTSLSRNRYIQIFEGECKDINTFRYICKLLNI